MALEQIGTDLEVGVGTTIVNYIVERFEDGDKEVSMKDVNDEDGVLATRIIKQRMDKRRMTLICKSGATPKTDWPKGAMATVAGWTQYFVDNATVEETEDEQRVNLELTNIGIT